MPAEAPKQTAFQRLSPEEFAELSPEAKKKHLIDAALRLGIYDNAMYGASFAKITHNVGSSSSGVDTSAAVLGMGAGVVVAAEVATTVERFRKGDTLDFDGFFSAQSLAQALETRFAGKDITVSLLPIRSDDDSTKIVLGQSAKGREPKPLLVLVHTTTTVPEDVKPAWVTSEKLRKKTSVRLSPLDETRAKQAGQEVLGDIMDLVQSAVQRDPGEGLREVLELLESGSGALALTQFPNEVCAVIEELGQEAVAERRKEVKRTHEDNEQYRQDVKSNRQCLYCETPRAEESNSCPGCSAPYRPLVDLSTFR